MLETNAAFETLLEYLRRNHNFDFSGYKRSSLMRRVQQRMDILHILSYTAYNDYLKEHPEDFNHLFNLIEINVTEFFRDALPWDYLATQIVPQIIAAKSSSEPIRIWSAGCASGEEAYSLAIILAEAIGVEQFLSLVKLWAFPRYCWSGTSSVTVTTTSFVKTYVARLSSAATT